MKKIISVILSAVILVMSAFSVNAFAQEQTRVEKWYENLTDITEYELIMKTKIGNMEADARCYCENGDIAIVTDMPLSDEKDIRIKAIAKDGYFYLTFPSLPFLYLKYDLEETPISDVFSETVSYEDLTLINAGETNEYGTTYYLEEYSVDENVSVKYYFEGENLCFSVASEVDEEGNEFEYISKFVSFEVDDSVFEIPWYSINITPIVILLSELLVG
ncbi:MAG: hypothetical protein IJE48_04490 [Clostridia bacterium]|nr:hypothetical protein [Clostridia bacterium]